MLITLVTSLNLIDKRLDDFYLHFVFEAKNWLQKSINKIITKWDQVDVKRVFETVMFFSRIFERV